MIEKKFGRKKKLVEKKSWSKKNRSIFFDKNNSVNNFIGIFFSCLFYQQKKNPRVSLASSLNISGYLWIAMENDPNKVKIHSFFMKKHQNSWKFIKNPSKSIIVRLKCTNFLAKNQCTNFLKSIPKMSSVPSSQHHISELRRSWKKNKVSRIAYSTSTIAWASFYFIRSNIKLN